VIDTSGMGALVRGDLDGVRGLAARTTLGDVRDVLEIDDARTKQSRLGADGIEVDSYSATLPESALRFSEGIWVHAVGGHVVLIAAKGPHRDEERGDGHDDGAKVIAPYLGEPETRLDAAIGTLMIPGSELVYATKGVALRVDPDGGELMAVLLFEPTTIDDYVRRVRPSGEPWRRLGFSVRDNWL